MTQLNDFELDKTIGFFVFMVKGGPYEGLGDSEVARFCNSIKLKVTQKQGVALSSNENIMTSIGIFSAIAGKYVLYLKESRDPN